MRLLPACIATLSATLLVTGLGIAPTNAQETAFDTLDPVTLPAAVTYDSTEETKELEASLTAYVNSSFDIEGKERQAEILRRNSDESKKESIQKTLDWESKQLEYELASLDADTKRDDAAGYAREVYKYGASPEEAESPSLLFGLFADHENADDKISAYNHAKHKGTTNKQKVDSASDRENEATSLRSEAAQIKDDADKKLEESLDQSAEAKKLTEELSMKVVQAEKTYQELSITANAAAFDVEKESQVSLSQKVINKALTDRWNDYLEKLDDANVDIPTLAEMNEEDFLEDNKKFVAYPDLNGNPTPQVVALESDPTTYVLPKETIETVSAQMRLLGDPYQTDGDGADKKWNCSAFASIAYGENRDMDFTSMWESSKEVDNFDKLPGDTVFFGSSESGLHHAGTYLGGGMFISSSLPTKHVSVEPVGYNSFGVTRPTAEPSDSQREAPVKSEDSLDWECGGLPGGMTQEGEWVTPIQDGYYDIYKEFGDEDEKRWDEETAPGMEFVMKSPEEIAEEAQKVKDGSENEGVAEESTDTTETSQTASEGAVEAKESDEEAVEVDPDNPTGGYARASAEGTVEVKLDDPRWGNMVIISHKDKMKTIYTHLAEVTTKNGVQVSKGETLGTIGATGEKTVKDKDSLMFIMEKDGKRVDPREFLFPAAPDAVDAVSVNINMPAGEFQNNYSNGKVPDEALCQIPQGGHKVRCEALASYLALNEAYTAQFGNPMCVTDSYRSYEAQVDVKRRKGNMAATPGTSKHGWGLALDLCDSVNTFGSTQHEWMRANAPKYGWFQPEWAQQGGSLPEAWHWEHVLSKSL